MYRCKHVYHMQYFGHKIVIIIYIEHLYAIFWTQICKILDKDVLHFHFKIYQIKPEKLIFTS